MAASGINDTLSYLYVACGEFDFIREDSDMYHTLLEKYGIRHEWVLTENDDHTWNVWRKYLKDFLIKAHAHGKTEPQPKTTNHTP